MQPFVSTAWLAEHLNDSDLVIIDIRGIVLPATQPPPHYFPKRDEYEQSHIPGAFFVDWTTDIVDPASGKVMQIARPEAFAALMSRFGVGDGVTVVAYDDQNHIHASRMVWALRYFGHEQVAVLDGGWSKWTREGHPTSSVIPAERSSVFIPRINTAIRVEADDVAAFDGLLIDVRTAAEFNGQASRASRAGHIPRAINIPGAALMNENATVLPPEKLAERFQAAGAQPDTPIVVYCNGGVSASMGFLALNAAGFHNVAVYDGSWKEWGNDESRPIAT